MFLWVYWHFDVKYLPCIVNCCTEVWYRMLRLCTYLLCVVVGAAHMFEPAADTPSVLQLSQTFSQWHLKASAWTCLFVQVVRPQSWNVLWKLDEELDKSVSWKECLFRLQEIWSQFDRSANVCVRASDIFVLIWISDHLLCLMVASVVQWSGSKHWKCWKH